MSLGPIALVIVLLLALLILILLLWFLWTRPGDAPPVPDSPFEPGASVDAVVPRELGDGIRTSLAGGRAAVAPPRVVWTELGDEVLVHLDSLAVVVEDGVIRASLDLESDETGRETLVVPIAVGGRREDGAALAVTEDLPLGHAGLAARWGHSVQTAVWAGVLDMARERADVADGVPGRVWVESGRVFFEASLPPTALAEIGTRAGGGPA